VNARQIGYPSGWTLAVLDDAAAARNALQELEGRGVTADDVVFLAGEDAAEALERLGSSAGFLGRMRRGLQFMTMDPLPDLVVYEEAMRLGHPVVGIRVADADRRRDLIAMLRRHGAHFINRFGAWATEEITPWRGRMPDLPHALRR